MPSGPGSLDPQGVWQFGEADTEALASDLFNLGQASVSTQFAADRSRLLRLESRASRQRLPMVLINQFVNPTVAADFPDAATKTALDITGFVKSGSAAQTALLIEADLQFELAGGAAQALDIMIATQLGAAAFVNTLVGRRYFGSTGRQNASARATVSGLAAGTYNIKPRIQSGAAATVNFAANTDWFSYTVTEIPA